MRCRLDNLHRRANNSFSLMTRFTHLLASTARITSVQPGKRQRQHHHISTLSTRCLGGECCKETRRSLMATILIGASTNSLPHATASSRLHQQGTMSHYRRYPHRHTSVRMTYPQRAPGTPGSSRKVGQRFRDQFLRRCSVIERTILLHRPTRPVRLDRCDQDGHWLVPPSSPPKITFPKASSVTSRDRSTSRLIISASRRSRIIRLQCCSMLSPVATVGV